VFILAQHVVFGQSCCWLTCSITQPCSFIIAQHVVFGEVVHGMPLIRLLERVGTVEGDRPEVPVVIADCGELTEEEFQAVVDASSTEGTKEAAALPPLPRPSSALTKMDIGGTDWP
jgi:cyclophilin family peptidyl-prolyl cis-trans isomerase